MWVCTNLAADRLHVPKESNKMTTLAASERIEEIITFLSLAIDCTNAFSHCNNYPWPIKMGPWIDLKDSLRSSRIGCRHCQHRRNRFRSKWQIRCPTTISSLSPSSFLQFVDLMHSYVHWSRITSSNREKMEKRTHTNAQRTLCRVISPPLALRTHVQWKHFDINCFTQL